MVLAQALDVKPDSLADRANRPCLGSARGYAAGQAWSAGGVLPRRFLDDDRGARWASHSSFSRACFTMRYQVPRGRSSLSLPAIVTVPGLSGYRSPWFGPATSRLAKSGELRRGP